MPSGLWQPLTDPPEYVYGPPSIPFHYITLYDNRTEGDIYQQTLGGSAAAVYTLPWLLRPWLATRG